MNKKKVKNGHDCFLARYTKLKGGGKKAMIDLGAALVLLAVGIALTILVILWGGG